MDTLAVERELKRAALILATLEERNRHGQGIARLIDERSRGLISCYAPSLYRHV